jgi:hypothetical protein
MGAFGLKNLVSFFKRWLSDRLGVAAVEAAFIAPIFVLVGLAVFDLGLAGTKRLQLDQALRAGAQVSMVNISEESEILAATLAALGEDATGSRLDDGICEPGLSCVDVTYACKCGVAAASCSQLCSASGEIPSAFLTIVASRRHDGLLLPDVGVSTKIMVQTR